MRNQVFDDEDDVGDGDEGLSESEWPDAADGDDSVDTRPCPYCREQIYDQAEQCPSCGSYISGEDTRSRKPLWIVIGVVLALAIVVFCWVL